jgi:hypothetical protein
MFFFEPDRSIRRVVTIATPHRGSEFSNQTTQWLGRLVIEMPQFYGNRNRVLQDNPNLFHDTRLLTIDTSIESLSPDSPMLPVMLQSNRAPWVTYHNIVGVVPEEGLLGRVADDGDGVVHFASAHLDDVESEIVVNADHVKVHRHPRSILEVRRILLEHLDEVQGRRGEQLTVRPVATHRH